MLHLITTVRLRGAVVESRALEVTGPFLVGEHPEARVGFPGLTLPVSLLQAEPHPVIQGAQREAAVAVGGIVLVPGQSHTLRNGPVEVEFTVERQEARAPWRSSWSAWSAPLADIRLLVASAALVVFALWVETVDRWVTTDPEVAAELAALPTLWQRSGPEQEAPPEAPAVRVLPVGMQAE